MRDPFAFFFAQYRKMGPAFQVKVLNKTFTVLAGKEAHELMTAHEEHVDSWQAWEGVITEFGGEKMVGMVGGEMHARYRRVLRQGMSRAMITNNIPTLFEIVKHGLDAYQPGDRIQVMPFMRQLVANQLGTLSLGLPAGEYLKDFLTYWTTVLQVRLIRALPESKLHTPEYLHAKARVEEMVKAIADKARRGELKNGESNLATDILNAMETDPDLFSEREMLFNMMIPYIAGLDTVANTLGFMIYHVLADAALRARIQAEIDHAFKQGDLSLNSLREMETLHSTAMEVLRYYPIAATLTRYAAEDFEFSGYHIRKGERLMVAPSAAHFSPQYFKEPDKFDPDRFSPPRSEHKQKGVYSPFGAGTHTCMGASMAEVQVPLTLMALLRYAHLEIDPPGYKVKRVYDPSLSPGKGFYLKMVERRE
jgi:cytochrome P450